MPDPLLETERSPGPELAALLYLCLSPCSTAAAGHQQDQGNKCAIRLIAPRWQNQLWFPDLSQMLSADSANKWPPLSGGGTIWHLWPKLWSLHVWPLNRSLLTALLCSSHSNWPATVPLAKNSLLALPQQKMSSHHIRSVPSEHFESSQIILPCLGDHKSCL